MDKFDKLKEEVRLREWGEMIRARTESGLPVTRWCERNNISTKTYYYRLRKVREGFCDEAQEHRIVPVAVPVSPDTGNSSVRISKNAMTIELHGDVAPDILRTILEVLKC